MWPLIAMAGMSLLQQSQANKQSDIQAKARAEDSIAESKAVMEANRKNFQASAFRVGMLNVQKAQQVRALEQQKFDTSAQQQAVLGTAAVNAAASGTIGASVDAVQSDIQMAFDKVRGQISDENELNSLNYNTALYDLVTEGQNKIVTASQYRKTESQSGMSMLLGAGLSVASTYVTAKMNLGLGSVARTGAGTVVQ